MASPYKRQLQIETGIVITEKDFGLFEVSLHGQGHCAWDLPDIRSLGFFRRPFASFPIITASSNVSQQNPHNHLRRLTTTETNNQSSFYEIPEDLVNRY